MSDPQADFRATLEQYLNRCIIQTLEIEAELYEVTQIGQDEPSYISTGRYNVTIVLANGTA